MNREKILLISHSTNKSGGGEDDFQSLLEYFHNKEYDVYGVFPKGYRADYFVSLCKNSLVLPDNIFPYGGLSLSKYLMFFYFTLQKLPVLLTFLNTVKKDISACFVNSSVCLAEIIALNIAGIRYTLSVKEVIRPPFVRNILYNYYNKSALSVIAISKFLKDLLSDGFSSNKLHIIHSSVNEDKLSEIKNQSVQRFNLGFRIVNSGVIMPAKNQELLINALQNIKSENKIIVDFIGRVEDYSYLVNLKELIAGFKNDNIKISFHNELKREEALKITNDADLIVVTSRSEGMSLVLAEALYFEKPVISTVTGVAQEVISDCENGFLVGFDDFIVLADRIDKIISDTQLRKSMSKKQSDVFRKNFNLDLCLKEHEKLILGKL